MQALGEFRALALAQAAEGLARRDLAALQNLGGLHAPVLGEGQQHVKDLRGLQVWGRVEQQRTDRHPAGLEVPFELRAKRANLVGRSERVHALIQVALGYHPVLERVLGGTISGPRLHARLAPRGPRRPRRRRVAQAGRHAPGIQLAVDQRRAAEQLQRLGCGHPAVGDLREVDFEEQLLVHRDGFVGLVHAVGETVGQHGPDDAVVVCVIDRLSDELLVLKVLVEPLGLDV